MPTNSAMSFVTQSDLVSGPYPQDRRCRTYRCVSGVALPQPVTATPPSCSANQWPLSLMMRCWLS